MKVFTAFVIFLLSNLITSGQCIPDTSITHNNPGNYPDSITGLPHASVGISYSTVIQTRILTDSTVGPFHAFVDSIVIDDVTGLPTGFTYSCYPINCSFPGGSNACILLQGSPPTIPMIGTYPLVVHTTIYYKISGTPQNLVDNNNDYSIIIDTTTGISSPDKIYFNVGQNVPNPAKEYTVIPVTMVHSDEISLTVVNLIGRKVLSHIYNLQKGKTNITLELRSLLPGIYLYTFSNGVTSVVRRMIITND